MPRNVRNFWITVNVDGRATPIEAGPQRADGGFRIIIQQRENGYISDRTVEIAGLATSDGRLRVTSAVVESNRALDTTTLLNTKR